MLTGKQKRQLRALGHHLEVVVQVGQKGVTDEVVVATEAALKTHELVKVKIADGPLERKEAAAELASRTEAELAQVLGRTALLFKQRKDKPKLKLVGSKAEPKEDKKAKKGE